MDRFDAMRAFARVVEAGSFTRAAARLFISQPAVTGHIKTLEEHYQITLLRRTARRVELTEEGIKLAAITRAMFGLVDEAQVMLEANRQLLTGRLEVAADGPDAGPPGRRGADRGAAGLHRPIDVAGRPGR